MARGPRRSPVHAPQRELRGPGTERFGIFGDPVGHTLSPPMQEAAFRALGIDAVYLPFRVPPERLGAALEGARSAGFRGLNITIPLKEAAFRRVRPTEAARRMKAVNAVDLRRGVGHNTDGEGALRALLRARVEPRGRRLLLLGAGGAARAAAHVLAERGAQVTIANRTLSRARGLAREVGGRAVPLGALAREAPRADIVVNATSAGMEEGCLLRESWLRPGQAVFDMVYRPPETELLRRARRRGARALSGVEMLVEQGAASFRFWTGREPPIGVMRRAVRERLQ
ncbi:MAG: shikimate dehydrogenase [Halobacteria archaeon]